MYSCRDIHDHASALVDRELSTREAMAVRMHLLMCSSCRRFVRQFRLLTQLVRREAQAIHVPSDTINRVLAELPLGEPAIVRTPSHDPQ